MSTFIQKLANKHSINSNSLAYLYMELKTKASDRDSKSRRSFGNLYAIYVLCQDYISGNRSGSRFTELMARMKSMPFGSKLQNHPLDNRLNDEVRRKFIENNTSLNNEYLPVVPVITDGKKGRKISESFLAHGEQNAKNSALFIVDVIDEYISIIDQNQTAYLNEISDAKTPQEISKIIKKAFVYESDARLFEIVSHAILFVAYRKITVNISLSTDEVFEEPLTLFKTGRTNANDGGIDFVLKPLGRFFQVTETLDFKKYFLDFDKMNRFPVTFVIKTDLTPEDTFTKIKTDALADLGVTGAEPYLELFEEIITNNELKAFLEKMEGSDEDLNLLKETVIDSYKLEFGLFD